MRSEERAGLISVILLLLWGTLLTGPFHIFTGYLYSLLTKLEKSVGIKENSAVFGFVTSILLGVICILLLQLSKTKAAEFIPCTAFILSGISILIKTVSERAFFVKESVIVVIALSIVAILHAARLNKVLLWLCDFVIFSIPMFLLTGLVTKPIGDFGKVVGKIFYINREQSVNITKCFKGLFGLPALLWGAVLFILLLLPIVYYAISKRRT